MVVVAIVTFFISIASFFIGLMPNMRIDFTPQNIDSFSSVISAVNVFVPVTHVAIVLGLVFLVYSIEFLWLLLNWLIAKIPTIE